MKWVAVIPDKRQRADRREQQAKEIEANQKALRDSIAESQRLVEESESILKRHRRERDEDDAD